MVKVERRGAREIVSLSGVRTTRRLNNETTRPRGDAKDDCCLTAIKFEKTYPDDMTVRLTNGNGQTVERTFTSAKKVRTAFIKSSGDPDDDQDQTTIVVGGLGRCVDVDVAIVDTSGPAVNPAQLAIAHYHFRLCCNDASVREGARLTHREIPVVPQGQVVKLPLLKIVAVRRDPCP
jgi:hypothetical protein